MNQGPSQTVKAGDHQLFKGFTIGKDSGRTFLRTETPKWDQTFEFNNTASAERVSPDRQDELNTTAAFEQIPESDQPEITSGIPQVHMLAEQKDRPEVTLP